MDLLDKENRTLLKYVTNNFNADRPNGRNSVQTALASNFLNNRTPDERNRKQR
jgi:hypothetical protein